VNPDGSERKKHWAFERYQHVNGHRTEWTAYTYPLAGVTDDHTLVFEFAKDDGSGNNGNGNNNQTGIGGAVNSALSQTGDNPWLVGGALLVLIAVVCALVARRMRQASTAAATEAAQRRAQFGWHWGVAAGFAHMTIVQNTGFLHGGMNLYNNGFAAGLVCILMIPIIEAVTPEPSEE